MAVITNRYFLLLLSCTFLIISCSVSKDPMRNQLKALQKGGITEDTSYVYSLPYKPGTAPPVVQGYFTRLSHKNRAAVDFKMKKGTGIYAARNGVVMETKADSDRGGWNKKYRPMGNHILIQHDDGSRAGYWHLQQNGVLVNVGDTIKQEQLIGLSGRTGYALFPHLHFVVWRIRGNNKYVPTGTRFNTSKGIVYLRPLRRYHHGK